MQIKVLSWNIHKCVGIDKLRSPFRILEVIRDINPDIAILQEVDRKIGKMRSTLPVSEIEEMTGMRAILSEANTSYSIGWHGNLLLVKSDITCRRQINIKLPSLEPRGAVVWELERRDQIFDVVGMHLGLLGLNRRRQAGAIASVIAARPIVPTIVSGDANDWWEKSNELTVVEDLLENKAAKLKTFPARRPILSLDRTMTGRGAQIINQQVVKGIIASDHLPLLSEIRIYEASQSER